MMANEIPSLIDKSFYEPFQAATLSLQGEVHTVVYEIVEQMLLDLIHQYL